MSKTNSLFFRSFLTKDKGSIFVVAEAVNLPIFKVLIKFNDVNVNNKSLSLSFFNDGDIYKDVTEDTLLPLFSMFMFTYVNAKHFNNSLSNFGDLNFNTTIANLDTITMPKEFDREITDLVVDSVNNTRFKLRKVNLKLMPKSKKVFNDQSLFTYIKDTFNYEIVENTFVLPNVLETYSSNANAWEHPVIKANPDKFKPKVDPDLVKVIQEESKELEYIMDSISKVNPAQPNKNYLLIGKPAIGKSETARAIAHLLNLPYAEYTFTKTTEFSDSVGKISATMIDQTDKSWAFLPTEVFAVMEAGGIVNFEEVAAMLESHQVEGNNVISGLNRYLYAAGHKVTVNDNTIFFGTTNAGLGGLSKMQAAFLSRWDQIEFTAPSSTTITKYYLKKYSGKLDPIIIQALVNLTFDIGQVLSNTEQFKREDPHWGAAPNINNRNRTALIFKILSYPNESVSRIVESFIRSQIHTNYFSDEVVDKVLVDCENSIASYNQIVSNFYNPKPSISALDFTFSKADTKTNNVEVEL